MGTRFAVIIGDNFHFMNEAHDYKQGTHSTAAAAIASAQRVVDEELEAVHATGMTADDLYRAWAQFGDSPWIVASDESRVPFSASEYAAARSAALTK